MPIILSRSLKTKVFKYPGHISVSVVFGLISLQVLRYLFFYSRSLGYPNLQIKIDVMFPDFFGYIITEATPSSLWVQTSLVP